MPPGFYNPYDQQVYDAGFKYIPQSKYLLNPFTIPTDDSTTTPPNTGGITTLPTGGGGGGTYTGGINDLMKNYTLDTRKQYFGSQPTPLVDNLYQSKLDKTFMGFPSYKQQQLTGPDMGEYIASNTDVPLELTTAGKLQSGLSNFGKGITGIANKIGGFGPISAILGSMDKFDSLSAADQEFIKQNMGYTGPTVFGSNDSGLSKDVFGINTRSAFGNYAEYVGEKASSLGESLTESAKKAGLSYNSATGEVEGDEDDVEAWKAKTLLKRKKFSFYTKKEKERIKNEEEMAKKAAELQAAKDKDLVDKLGVTAADVASTTTQGGGGGIASEGMTGAQAAGMGGGSQQATSAGSTKSGRTDGGWGWADGGRVYYMNGGLADMLEIYD